MKKLSAFLLALLMLVLPVLSYAASPAELFAQAAEGQPYTVSGQLTWGNTALLDSDTQTLVKDVVDAISFTLSKQENQTDFALQLSGTDVLTLATAAAGEDTYLLSNLLGDTIAFNQAEGEVILGYLANLAVASGMMTADDIAELQAAIQGADAADADMSLEDMDFSALIAWAESLNLEPAAVTQQPEGCDTATQVVAVTLTGEDMAQLYSMLFDLLEQNEDFRTSLRTALEQPDMTDEELSAALDSIALAIGDMVQGDIPVAVYLDDEHVVCMTASITMTADDSTVTMDMHYDRLTTADGVTHTATINATDENDGSIVMAFTLLNGDKATQVTATIGESEDEAIFAFTLTALKDYGDDASALSAAAELTINDGTESITLGLQLAANAAADGDNATFTCDADLYFLGEELLSVQLNAATSQAAAPIVTSDAVRPGQMTEEEFSTYLSTDVMNALQLALVNLIQSLPASVLSMLMG